MRKLCLNKEEMCGASESFKTIPVVYQLFVKFKFYVCYELVMLSRLFLLITIKCDVLGTNVQFYCFMHSTNNKLLYPYIIRIRIIWRHDIITIKNL